MIENHLLNAPGMTSRDFYDHITFIIPQNKQISNLVLTSVDISSNYTIIYKIQRDTSGVYFNSSDYLYGSLTSSTSNNIDLIPTHKELKGGFADISGTQYAMLLYLIESNYTEEEKNITLFYKFEGNLEHEPQPEPE